MKLISMTDFVLEQKEILAIDEIDLGTFALRIFKYTNFLKQPLELWMLVPCDENNVPLEEPKEKPTVQSDGTIFDDYDVIEVEKYEQAKERVLFEGFELLRDVGYAWIFKYNVQGETLFYKKIEFGIIKSNKIEDLIIDFPEQLTITPNAIKQLGL